MRYLMVWLLSSRKDIMTVHAPQLPAPQPGLHPVKSTSLG